MLVLPTETSFRLSYRRRGFHLSHAGYHRALQALVRLLFIRDLYYVNVTHRQATENRNSSGVSNSISCMNGDNSDLGDYCAELITLGLPGDPITEEETLN